MFKTKNRNYLMKVENFTQNLSQVLQKCSMIGLLMIAMLQSNDAIAQCPLACNNNVQVSMDNDCMVEVTPDMMLEGQGTNVLCDYQVTVLDQNNNPIPNSPFVGGAYIGQTLNVSVYLGQNHCWGRIIVEDKMPPVIDCPADITLDCYDDRTFALPPATDNCGGFVSVKELSNEVDDTACQGDTTATRTIRYIATDASGNKSQICERRIYYIKIGIDDVVFPANRDDNELPALDCDSNPNDNINPAWDLNGDGYPQPEESGVPETFDGYPIYPNNSICELNATFTDQVLPICESSFKVLRQWVILDWCTGTVLKDFQIIKIIDDQGPIVTCPSDNQEVFADPYECTGTWVVPPPVEIFDCSSTTYTVGYLLADEFGGAPVNGVYIDDNVYPINQGNSIYEIRDLPVGRTWIRYTVEDACGNITRCFTEVDVYDNVPPVAVCDQFTVVTLTNNSTTQGVASIYATTFDDGSHDNCTDVTLDVRRMTSGCGQSTSQYREKVNFCCQDVGREIMVELRVKDENDLYNYCMVNVTVQDKTDPIITCPPNITIQCDDDYLDLDVTGEAEAYDNCGNPTITFTDNTTPNQCGVGTIRRTFTATIGGATKTCSHTITIRDDFPFNSGNINWSGINDRTLNGCMEIDTDPSVTGRPTWTSDDCSLIAASYNDQVFTLVDSACFKILRTWTIIDWCQFDPNFPQYGGTYSRTQVIKLHNKVKPEFTDCSDKMADGYGEDCDGYIELINEATDDCTPSNKLKISYRIDENADGTYGNPVASTDASGTYPVGVHKILWTVEDLCGNRNECEYTFEIKDKKKPTPYCLSEITTVVMPSSKEIDIWASDFDRGSFDNCPGGVSISFSTSITDTRRVFTCDDLGINMLEMWVTDAAGNQDYCTVRINIQSNDGSCEGSRVAGMITTESNTSVDNVSVALENMASHEKVVKATQNTGAFHFEGLNSGTEYMISPSKKDDYMNGVTTLDLVLIQRHILGIAKFDSPYKVIAADINNSEKISASDLVELRKLILGIYNKLPNNDSWRFVEEAYTMPDAENPWPFNQVIDFMYEGTDMLTNNFKAIKVGDVNGSAKANLRDNSSDNRSSSTLTLSTQNINFSKDELIRVPVKMANDSEIFGFQFGIEFNADLLEFVGIEARGVEMTEDNIGMENIHNGVINTSWNDVSSIDFDAQETLFDVVFKAKAYNELVGNLTITDEGTVAEAYDENLSVMDVELSIRSVENEENGLALYQNTPNPFDNTTSIRFTLPNDGMASLKVVDVTGRTLLNVKRQFMKGENEVLITSDQIDASGVLYYMLEANGQTITKKMILIKE